MLLTSLPSLKMKPILEVILRTKLKIFNDFLLEIRETAAILISKWLPFSSFCFARNNIKWYRQCSVFELKEIILGLVLHNQVNKYECDITNWLQWHGHFWPYFRRFWVKCWDCSWPWGCSTLDFLVGFCDADFLKYFVNKILVSLLFVHIVK